MEVAVVHMVVDAEASFAWVVLDIVAAYTSRARIVVAEEIQDCTLEVAVEERKAVTGGWYFSLLP